MKNIWWIICLIAVGAGAWYFNQNYLSKVPSTLEENNPVANPVASTTDKEVLVFVGPDGKTKTINLEKNIGTLEKPISAWPNPAISSDGQKQALVEFSNAERDFGYSLFTADKDKANKKRITQNDEAITLPRWSEDGRSIYYLQAKGGRTALMQIALEASVPKEILSENGVIIDFVLVKDDIIAYLLLSDTQNSLIGDIIIADKNTKTKQILTKATKILGWLP